LVEDLVLDGVAELVGLFKANRFRDVLLDLKVDVLLLVFTLVLKHLNKVEFLITSKQMLVFILIIHLSNRLDI
jgi:hypothetical protein